jgi:hypothetical protein
MATPKSSLLIALAIMGVTLVVVLIVIYALTL